MTLCLLTSALLLLRTCALFRVYLVHVFHIFVGFVGNSSFKTVTRRSAEELPSGRSSSEQIRGIFEMRCL